MDMYNTVTPADLEKNSFNIYPENLHLAQNISPQLKVLDEQGQNLLHLAAKNGDLKLTKQLIDDQHAIIDMPDNQMETPLYIALLHKHFALASLLIEAGASMHTLTQDDDTNRYSFQTLLHQVVKKGRLDIAYFLIKSGAHIDAQDIAGETPLHLAVKHRQFNIVKLLLQKNAIAHLCDKAGNTTLAKAINALNKSDNSNILASVGIVKLLIEIGIETVSSTQDLLNNIFDLKICSDIKRYRENTFKMAQQHFFALQNTSDLSISSNRTRCFLYTYFKIFSWKQQLPALHTHFQQAIKHISLQSALPKRVLQLEVQFKIIRYLEDSLEDYNPGYPLESAEPIAFQVLIELHEFSQQTKLLSENLSALYEKLQALIRFYPLIKGKEVYLKEVLGDIEIDRLSLNDLQHLFSIEWLEEIDRIFFFDIFKDAFTLQDTNTFFLKRWYYILSKYIEKTLPYELHASWDPNDVSIACSHIGLNNTLHHIWANDREKSMHHFGFF